MDTVVNFLKTLTTRDYIIAAVCFVVGVIVG